jgi:hypothetical protein
VAHDVLLDEVEVLELLEVAEQGPPGPPGPSGGTGEQSPVMTYTGDLLTRIDYASGHYKTMTYAAGLLTQVDYVTGAVTTRKTFAYNPDGSLASITDSTL